VNLNELNKIVAVSIGQSEEHVLDENWEWDSLDHLSIVMNLQKHPELDLNLLGDLSSINSVAKLIQRIEEVGM
jgi:acyl carrier protein